MGGGKQNAKNEKRVRWVDVALPNGNRIYYKAATSAKTDDDLPDE